MQNLKRDFRFAYLAAVKSRYLFVRRFILSVFLGGMIGMFAANIILFHSIQIGIGCIVSIVPWLLWSKNLEKDKEHHAHLLLWGLQYYCRRQAEEIKKAFDEACKRKGAV